MHSLYRPIQPISLHDFRPDPVYFILSFSNHHIPHTPVLAVYYQQSSQLKYFNSEYDLCLQ